MSSSGALELGTMRNLEMVPLLVLSFFLAATGLSTSSNGGKRMTYNYFAFGSNMLTQTMTDLRNLSPLASTAAVLPSHELRFNVPGTPLIEPSWASVEPRTDSVVHGVLYSLSEEDFAAMCASEGVPFAYTLHRCRPVPYKGDGTDAGQRALTSGNGVGADPSPPRGVPAFTLRASNRRWRESPAVEDPSPSQSYLNVLIRGAKEFGLDGDYLKMLETKEAGRALFGGTAERMLDVAVARGRTGGR